MNDCLNGGPGNSKFCCKVKHFDYSRNISSPNIFNLSAGQLAVRAVLTTQGFPSSARIHIPNVILLSSKLKVFGIYTHRVVAFMTNAEAIWNWSLIHNPRRSVRTKHDVGWPVAHSDLSVPSGMVSCSDPCPTSIGDTNLAPKPSGECRGQSLRAKILSGNLRRHIISSIVNVLAPLQRQLRGAFSFVAKPIAVCNSL